MKYIKRLLNRIRGEQDLNKLIKRGLKLGNNLTRMSGCIIDPSHCWHIEIGDDVILAPKVHILAHDASTKIFLGYTRIANVRIGNKVFIGAGTIILPGVSVGDNVIIGAGSVVSQNIPTNSVAIGSPARVISSLDDYIKKEKIKMCDENVFSSEYTLRNPKLSIHHRSKMIEACEKFDHAFVE
jgi:maltose O-acetyltransferase